MAIPAWLTIVSWIFIGVGMASAAVIVADIYLVGYREHVKIMEAVWPLTALYAGPLALAAYFRWGRPMSHRWMQARRRGMPGKPFWAGTAVSATHSGAGCVLGDLIAGSLCARTSTRSSRPSQSRMADEMERELARG